MTPHWLFLLATPLTGLELEDFVNSDFVLEEEDNSELEEVFVGFVFKFLRKKSTGYNKQKFSVRKGEQCCEVLVPAALAIEL